MGSLLIGKKSLSNPYAAGGNAYKIQPHCHSTSSDGERTPAEVMAAYKALGYDAVFLTDHVALNSDPEVAGIQWFQGCEYECKDEAEAVQAHINGWFCESVEGFGPPDPVGITTLLALMKLQPMLIGLNHPTAAGQTYNITMPDELDQMANDIGFIEVYNGGFVVQCDDKWSYCLDTKTGPVWGIASDDSHLADGSQDNKGWIVLYAPSLTAANVKAALQAGNFYATGGAAITSIVVSGHTVTITLPDAGSVYWVVTGNKIVQTTTGITSASYTVQPKDKWARAIIYRNSNGKYAWTQPFFVE